MRPNRKRAFEGVVIIGSLLAVTVVGAYHILSLEQLLGCLTAIGALWAAYATTGSMREAQRQSAYERTPFLRLQWNRAENAITNLGQYVPVVRNTAGLTDLSKIEFSDIEILNEGRGLAIDVYFAPIDIQQADVWLKTVSVIPSKGRVQAKFEDTVDTSEKFYCRQEQNHIFRIHVTYFDIEKDKYEAIFESDDSESDGF